WTWTARWSTTSSPSSVSTRVAASVSEPPAPTLPGARTGVSSKDVVIDPRSGLWTRLYLPATGRQGKLPVVVYCHGGAFVIGSTTHRPTHEYLNSLAAGAGALVVSPEYRLAPEHPLPTAHDDSWQNIRWVASHAAAAAAEGPEHEPWIAEHGDLSRVFLAGVSAGGNIAHHMAVRAAGGGGLSVRVTASGGFW
ncbi:unnamed protein product, partial [Urochloa humidicola]